MFRFVLSLPVASTGSNSVSASSLPTHDLLLGLNLSEPTPFAEEVSNF